MTELCFDALSELADDLSQYDFITLLMVNEVSSELRHDMYRYLQYQNYFWMEWKHANLLLHSHLMRPVLKLMNPVEFAFMIGNLTFINWAYPKYQHLFNDRCHYLALRYGHLDAVQWLLKNNLKFPSASYNIALRYGHPDVCEWIHYNQEWRDTDDSEESSDDAPKKMHEKKKEINHSYCWSPALRSDRLDTIQWAHTVYPLSRDRDPKMKTRIFSDVISGCKLEIVKWFYDTYLDFKLFKGFEKGRMENLHYWDIEFVQWLRIHMPQVLEGIKGRILVSAHTRGDFEYTEWLLDNNICDMDNSMPSVCIRRACESGNLEYLKWVASYHCPIEKEDDNDDSDDSDDIPMEPGFLMKTALRSGDLEMINWVYTNIKNLTGEDTVIMMSHNIHELIHDDDIQSIRWLHDNGIIKYQPGYYKEACEYGAYEVMMFFTKIASETPLFLDSIMQGIRDAIDQDIEVVIDRFYPDKVSIWESRRKVVKVLCETYALDEPDWITK